MGGNDAVRCQLKNTNANSCNLIDTEFETSSLSDSLISKGLFNSGDSDRCSVFGCVGMLDTVTQEEMERLLGDWTSDQPPEVPTTVSSPDEKMEQHIQRELFWVVEFTVHFL